jgi:hypothetical protein
MAWDGAASDRRFRRRVSYGKAPSSPSSAKRDQARAVTIQAAAISET